MRLMGIVLPKRGTYSGRLAFDPDSGFHIDPDGRRVVTDDRGATWRYANRGDMSHFARYHERDAVITGTTEADPHHVTPTQDDDHYDPSKITNTTVKLDDDVIGHLNWPVLAKVEKPRLIGRGAKIKRVRTDEIERGNPLSTSHTDAWR